MRWLERSLLNSLTMRRFLLALPVVTQKNIFFSLEFFQNIVDNFRHIFSSMKTGEGYEAEEFLLESAISIDLVLRKPKKEDLRLLERRTWE
jgi:hypothetical protein